ncbi:MAG TPA: cytochrome c oxidase subunit 3 [Macromonas sp.]|nr:cytochrome c oxidase subunit 3 [Macromonas sp.]
MSPSLTPPCAGREQKKAPALTTPAPSHFPGDPLIWVFVLGDMAVFSMFFCVYGYFRNRDLGLYQQAQTLLNMHYGAVNSLILLLSSWFVVMMLGAVRRGEHKLASHFIGAAFLCGLTFSILKYFEYQAKLDAGITYATNPFFTFYYLLTGLHFAHLLCGLGVLAWFYFPLRVRNPNAEDLENLESTAVYWHMVDLLWIVIFALLYLLP